MRKEVTERQTLDLHITPLARGSQELEEHIVTQKHKLHINLGQVQAVNQSPLVR